MYQELDIVYTGAGPQMSECMRAKSWLVLLVSEGRNNALVILPIVQAWQCGGMNFKSSMVSYSLVASFFQASA